MPDRLFSDADLAALYDAFCPRETRADFDFYLPMIMSAQSVLDVGCGTGALLHEVWDAGHAGRLVGLDPAAGMLAQARRRSDIEWVQGDLVSAGFAGGFDLTVMTGHAFQVLVTDDDLRAALAAARRALTADGRFAFETRNPAKREWERWRPDHAASVTGPDGAVVRMAREVTAPFDGRTVSFTHTFTSPAWDRPQLSRSTLRFLDAPQLAAFLGEAGLAVEAQFGDWDRAPLTDSSPEIITIARPA
ncbi:MAG: methyltransferase domain-containing protein [Caulobacteraceae bacterium]